MALQTSGPITMADIAGEFGGTAPHALSEYYGAASGIPLSGTIVYSDFYGASDFNPAQIYASRYGIGNTTTINRTVTFPAGTQSVIVGATTLANGYAYLQVSSVRVNGVTLSQVAGVNTATEYNTRPRIWQGSVDLSAGGNFVVSSTQTWTDATASGAITIWAMNKPLIGTPDVRQTTATTLSTTIPVYSGGLVVAVFQCGAGGSGDYRPVSTRINAGDVGNIGGAGSYGNGYCWCYPTVNQTLTARITMGSGTYAYGCCMASYGPQDFAP